MFREARVENGMTIRLCGTVFYGCWKRRQEVGGFVEERFRALGYELWRGTGGVGEDCWERDDRLKRWRWSARCCDGGHDRCAGEVLLSLRSVWSEVCRGCDRRNNVDEQLPDVGSVGPALI